MDQMKKEEISKQGDEGKKVEEGLPVESSPYTQYKDLEDYKRQGYGTHGHQQPVPGRGGGSTDAPTLSGDSAVAAKSVDLSSTEVINRHGAH